MISVEILEDGGLAVINGTVSDGINFEKYEKNPIGSAGFNDMFSNASKEINAISEPCDSI